MAPTDQFVPPSRLARMGSLVMCLFLIPVEMLIGRWWDGATPSTLRGRIAFWVCCEGWFHYERAPGLAVHRREGEWRLLVHGEERPQGFHTTEAAIEYAEARYAR